MNIFTSGESRERAEISEIFLQRFLFSAINLLLKLVFLTTVYEVLWLQDLLSYTTVCVQHWNDNKDRASTRAHSESLKKREILVHFIYSFIDIVFSVGFFVSLYAHKEAYFEEPLRPPSAHSSTITSRQVKECNIERKMR